MHFFSFTIDFFVFMICLMFRAASVLLQVFPFVISLLNIATSYTPSLSLSLPPFLLCPPSLSTHVSHTHLSWGVEGS